MIDAQCEKTRYFLENFMKNNSSYKKKKIMWFKAKA